MTSTGDPDAATVWVTVLVTVVTLARVPEAGPGSPVRPLPLVVAAPATAGMPRITSASEDRHDDPPAVAVGGGRRTEHDEAR